MSNDVEIEVVMIVYNGVSKPFSVFTQNKKGYIEEHDFEFKKGFLESHCSGGGSQPYLNKLIPLPRKRKLWFKEEFRPKSGDDNRCVLTNAEIESMGYKVIPEPLLLEEIIDTILYG